jgi:hypothetical protein
MNRRNFLTRSGLALGALIVGDEVLEMLDRLTHRKVYALGGVPRPKTLIQLAKELHPSDPNRHLADYFMRSSHYLTGLRWVQST